MQGVHPAANPALPPTTTTKRSSTPMKPNRGACRFPARRERKYDRSAWSGPRKDEMGRRATPRGLRSNYPTGGGPADKGNPGKMDKDLNGAPTGPGSVFGPEISADVSRRLRRHRVGRGVALRQGERDAERLAAGPAFAGPVPAAPVLADGDHVEAVDVLSGSVVADVADVAEQARVEPALGRLNVLIGREQHLAVQPHADALSVPQFDGQLHVAGADVISFPKRRLAARVV